MYNVNMKLNEAQKIKGLVDIYTNAKIVFPYFNKLKVDFDDMFEKYTNKVLKAKTLKEYYLVLSEFITLLNDGHTNISFPSKCCSYLPFSLLQIKNNFYIYGKKPNTQFSHFSKILKINNEDFNKFVKAKISPIIHNVNGYFYNGKVEKLLPLFLKPKNNILQTDAGIVKFNLEKEQVTNLIFPPLLKSKFKVETICDENKIKILKFDDIIYFKIDTFNDFNILKYFQNNLNELKKSKACIIDVRENDGGMTKISSQISGHFFSEEYSGCLKFTRTIKGLEFASSSQYKRMSKEKIENLIKNNITTLETVKEMQDIYSCNKVEYYYDKFEPIAPFFKGKVIVLTSKNTISACEDFVCQFKGKENCLIIGEQTYGSTGTPLILKLPFGGSCRICSVGYKMKDGNEFINKGIMPDIYKSLTIENYKKQTDIVLNFAIEKLKKEIN